MKHITPIILFSLLASSLVPAVELDVEGLGAALRGWKKDRTAVYGIHNKSYRTHLPTSTPTREGGMFITTRIEEGNRLSSRAVCLLELTFSPDGTLEAAQIRATMAGKRLDTGLVSRLGGGDPLAVPAEGIAGGAERSSAALVADLFTRFDRELGKLDAKDGEKPRRDILGRLTGASHGQSDVPAALRHNLNLLLAHVRAR